jgi:hypothetical protein
VALIVALNIVQPFSIQLGSPVMRYMYQTDSMASGLAWGLAGFENLEQRGEGCGNIPEDILWERD